MKSSLAKLLLCLSALSLSACQLMPTNKAEVAAVGDTSSMMVGKFSPAAYYLQIAELSDDQVFNELETLLLDPDLGDNSIKLGLLYAYKKSPVKNPHRAHAAFNRALSSQQTVTQKGMIIALNDQLADALRWQHKYENLGTAQQQQQLLLQQQIAALKMQLDELTRIEQQLNERN
ncbi:hypothetical protein ACVFI8_09625 [Agarivorans sp. MS3-6]|uniref:hypothetical protein n=1 Tax=Agarivorans sp. TSD2052 TaxID=2937286 RepID=UPI00200D8A45|nr:hypothetical protein [Agarivorans sp. TSD2052]UPW18746.1 hypothetical protein M0C34_00285 [Agarivorans sp. TSD2052]